MYKCIGCGEISTDLKAHIEEKHKDVGNDIIVHAMKSQCDWCGLNNSELKYFNFSFSDVKYVKSCQQSLNLAIDLKKSSSHDNDGFGEHVNVFIIFGQFLVIFRSVLDTLHVEKSSKNWSIL